MTIRSAKPGVKIVKLSDGGGLQLWITPDGAKRWRLAYRYAGNQKNSRHRRLSCDRPSRRARSEGTGKTALEKRD
ncbi:MAG TPA: Arm DNA-binding domain-containing protein [Methylocella sp.]